MLEIRLSRIQLSEYILESSLETVYLGLGTNLGDRSTNLRRAIEGLGEQILIVDESPVYETDAWGVEDQPDFLNMVVIGATKLDPYELLKFVKQLERRLGRMPSERWGPRVIDIDILFYEQLILDDPILSIPHKDAANRATVLIPLADVMAELQHPVLLKPISYLLELVDKTGVRPYSIG